MKKQKTLIMMTVTFLLFGCQSISSSSSNQSLEDNSNTSSETKNSYQLAFQTDSDEIFEPINVEEGTTVFLASLPILDDRDEVECRFVCWTKDNIDVISDFVMPAHDVLLVARWRALKTWTISYITNVDDYTVNDTVIDENEGLENFIPPVFNPPYKLFKSWCYDQNLTQPIGDVLDENQFINNRLTLYAQLEDTDVGRTSHWVNVDGIYSGTMTTEINSVLTAPGKTVNVDIVFPKFDKNEPFGSSQIYFGGKSPLFSEKNYEATSGYKITFTGSIETEPDTPERVCPRAGCIQVFKYNTEQSKFVQILGVRRYNAPFIGSQYLVAYDAYAANGTTQLVVNVQFIFGEKMFYINIMGTRLAEFEYQNDGQAFGVFSGIEATVTTHAQFKNLTMQNAPQTTVTFDPGEGEVDRTTKQVNYGDAIGTLPVATRGGYDFQGWKVAGKTIDETYVPGTVENIIVSASWRETDTETYDVWDGTAADNLSGTGAEEDPFLITSAKDLKLVSLKVNAGEAEYVFAHYRLETGIDLDNLIWVPIGNAKTVPFSGVFDGNNHKIKNLKMTGANYQGLFGYLVDADILNLTINQINIVATAFFTGGIAGVMFNSKIHNCKVAGTISGCRYKLGGIVGSIENVAANTSSRHMYSIISDCINDAIVTLSFPDSSAGTATAGGILGQNNIAGTLISDCRNNGEVSGGDNVAGILARANEVNITIQGCVNTGVINSTSWAGGIVGMLRKHEGTILKTSFNYGDVNSALGRSGGIVSIVRAYMTECYCANNVKIDGILVSEQALWNPTSNVVMPGAAIAWQNDGGAGCGFDQISNCGLCTPLS
ncbi:MAG: InlB B-repeat-containing protein [Bacilli bacterium]